MSMSFRSIGWRDWVSRQYMVLVRLYWQDFFRFRLRRTLVCANGNGGTHAGMESLLTCITVWIALPTIVLCSPRPACPVDRGFSFFTTTQSL